MKTPSYRLLLVVMALAIAFPLAFAVSGCGAGAGVGAVTSNLMGGFAVKGPIVNGVVEAYILLAEKMEDESIHGNSFNFSNEIQKTVLDVVRLIMELMRRQELEPEILNQVSGEIEHQYLSAKKARQVLGWKPLYTLEKGLAETIEWYKKYFAEEKHD